MAVIEDRHVERLVQTESAHAVGDVLSLSSAVSRMTKAATAMETIPITIAAMNQFLRTASSLDALPQDVVGTTDRRRLTTALRASSAKNTTGAHTMSASHHHHGIGA
jgi:hypothetical protein